MGRPAIKRRLHGMDGSLFSPAHAGRLSHLGTYALEGWGRTAVLGTMAALAAAMTALITLRPPWDEEAPGLFSFDRNAAIAIAGSIGFAGGIVGQGEPSC